MKLLKSNIIALFITIMAFGLTGCKEADPNFVHTNNLISAMVCESERVAGSPSINGIIYEYDKNGALLDPGFDPVLAEGGSGVIVFIVGPEDRKTFDLTKVYLRATLTFDEFITPTLSGLHNILVDDEHPEGMVIAVTSGVGTVRKYRIMGIYE